LAQNILQHTIWYQNLLYHTSRNTLTVTVKQYIASTTTAVENHSLLL